MLCILGTVLQLYHLHLQALLQKQDIIHTRHINYRDEKSAERNGTIHQLEDERMFSRFFQEYQHIQVGKKIKTRNIYRNVNRTWHQIPPSLLGIDPSTQFPCHLWILLHPTQLLQT